MAKKNQIITTAAELVPEYYSYDAIMSIPAIYRMIIGQRSNGKTYGWCGLDLEHYFSDGLPSAYVRRLDEMIKPSIIGGLFDPHIDYIQERSGGKWNGIEYRGHEWRFVRREKDKLDKIVTVAKDAKPFCRAYSINTAETTKGVDYGEIWSICFDEFITRTYYLTNEFVMFQNLLSTLIRKRAGVNIFMLANTVSKHCPYFAEMGLYRIRKQEQGTIDIYKIGKSSEQIAVEYCAQVGTSQKVASYFAFDNPQLDMITSGAWELALYRHAPEGLADYKIMLSFFIMIDGHTVQGDIIQYKQYPLIFFHPKTSEIRYPEKSIIYAQNAADGNPLHQRDLTMCYTRAQIIIRDLIKSQKTFYSDNETGETVAAWLRPMHIAAR